MADFVAVLKKTLDGLNNPTPETRQRVYERARSTIIARMDVMNPPPPASVRDAQLRALEDAVKTVEQGYVRKSQDPLDELEDVFRSLNGLMNQPTTPAPKPAPVPPPRPPVSAEVRPPIAPRPLDRPVGDRPAGAGPLDRPRADPLPRKEISAQPDSQRTVVPPRPVTTPIAPPVASVARPASEQLSAPPPKLPPVRDPSRPAPTQTPDAPASRDKPRAAPPKDELSDFRFDAPSRNEGVGSVANRDAGLSAETRRVVPPEREKAGGPSFGKIAAVLLGVAALGGAGYGVWLNRDDFQRLVGMAPPTATETVTPPANETPAPVDTAEVQPAAETPAGEPAEPVKLTQRLNEDGSEVDMGPAAGEPVIGEGTSVAAVSSPSVPVPLTPAVDTPPAPADTPVQQQTPPADDPAAATDPNAMAAATPEQPAAPVDPAAPAPASVPAADGSLAVAQKAIFYEERTSSAQGSAEPGTTVWSLVQESPGGGRPPEPAIKGVISIPDREIGISVTIRRNADPTLPASHIMEMIFITPDNFAEGTVDNILRVALKSDEEQPGSPIIGLPAKIGDGFFLVALNNSKAEVDANMNLLQRQNWMDIAFVYKSGRRALVTMEKGVPGEKVFDEAMKAWGVASAG